MKTNQWFKPRTVAALLFMGAAVYLAGAVAEASVASVSPITPTAVASPAAASAGETGNEGTEHPSSAATPAKTESVGGFNPEAPIFVVLAALIFVGLGIATWLRAGRAILVAVIVVALLATALDIREVIHQLAEGRAVLVMIASLLIVIHLTTAGAGAGAAQRLDRAG